MGFSRGLERQTRPPGNTEQVNHTVRSVVGPKMRISDMVDKKGLRERVIWRGLRTQVNK